MNYTTDKFDFGAWNRKNGTFTGCSICRFSCLCIFAKPRNSITKLTFFSRLRTANILIAGLNGLGAEITKNIILSGVNLVQLQDDQLVTEEDFCSQFLAPRESLGSNRAEASLTRARALNPMVDISADTQPLKEKTADYFSKFDVVVINGESNEELLRIDNICRELGIKFFATELWGMFGYHYASLQKHSYVE